MMRPAKYNRSNGARMSTSRGEAVVWLFTYTYFHIGTTADEVMKKVVVLRNAAVTNRSRPPHADPHPRVIRGANEIASLSGRPFSSSLDFADLTIFYSLSVAFSASHGRHRGESRRPTRSHP